jgi:mannose-1-phosphate guanylyltransferase
MAYSFHPAASTRYQNRPQTPSRRTWAAEKMTPTSPLIAGQPSASAVGSPSLPAWSLVLAGGDGRRLRPLTRRISGDERPKQFCKVLGQETLVEQTLRRAAMLVAPGHVLAAVVHAHERFYAPLLDDIPAPSVLIQPEDRGSATAVFYGALRLLSLSADAPVAIFPSDHYVADDRAFVAHVNVAVDVVRARPDLLVLVGIAPDTDEVEYQWIEPADVIRGPWPGSLFKVRHLWQTPPRIVAEALLRSSGGLWNSVVMVARPSALLSLIRHAVPRLAGAFTSVELDLGTSWEEASLRKVYSHLPSTDFANDVLKTRTSNLAVLPLDGVGWNDLGEPRRVMATLDRIGARPAWAAAANRAGRATHSHAAHEEQA